MIASSSSLIPLLAALGYNQQFNESMIAYMKSLGYTKSFNESLYDYLASLGYSGDLNNKLYLWSLAGYALTGGLAINTYPKFTTSLLVVGATISTAYVAGSYTWVSGAVTEASVAYYVDGGLVASNYVLAAGDVLIEATVSITATGLPGGTTVQAIPNSVQNTAPHAIASATQTISVVPGDGSGDAFAPDAMGAPTLASTATRITVTLASDPADNNSPITDRQARYSLDAGGTWSTPASIVSGGVITGMVPGTTGILVQTRAINSIDPDPNNWSTSTSITMKNITFLGFTANSGTTATYDIDLTTIDTTNGGAGGPLVAGDFGMSATGWSISNTDGNPGVSGWTEEDDLFGNDETRDINLSVSWKVMGGTPDTVATVTGNSNTAEGACGVIAWYRYVDPVSPISTKGTAVVGKDTALADPPSMTPTEAGSLSLEVVGASGDTTPQDLVASTGFTLAGRRKTGGTVRGARFLIAHKTWTSGSEDPVAITSSESTTGDSWAANVYSLKPY